MSLRNYYDLEHEYNDDHNEHSAYYDDHKHVDHYDDEHDVQAHDLALDTVRIVQWPGPCSSLGTGQLFKLSSHSLRICQADTDIHRDSAEVPGTPARRSASIPTIASHWIPRRDTPNASKICELPIIQ